MLKVDKKFTPCPVDVVDELYPKGIFDFNITKILEHLQKRPESTVCGDVAVSDFPYDCSSIDESQVESTDISIPAPAISRAKAHQYLTLMLMRLGSHRQRPYSAMVCSSKRLLSQKILI